MSNSESISISDEELDSINQAILSRYGLDFSQYEPSSMKRRIVRVISKFSLGGVFGLWQKLLYDPKFIHCFRDEVAVGLTEMFRNPDMWQYLRNKLSQEQNQSISVWHAGISTGEEVYSMAIMLEESKRLFTSKILATDMSDKFVSFASKGTYEKESFSKYEKNYKTFNEAGNFNRYFEQSDNDFSAKSFLKSNIRFEHQNILSDSPNETFDWILCRNVMIYFNDQLKLKALSKFADHLKPNGSLIIGYFDAMPDAFDKYFAYESHGYKVFQKR